MPRYYVYIVASQEGGPDATDWLPYEYIVDAPTLDEAEAIGCRRAAEDQIGFYHPVGTIRVNESPVTIGSKLNGIRQTH